VHEQLNEISHMLYELMFYVDTIIVLFSTRVYKYYSYNRVKSMQTTVRFSSHRGRVPTRIRPRIR
jgi:hypothetical protein